MERRHQVFVSSTYTDLIEERAAAIEALLRMKCFPAGMELFPASNDDSWTLIERVISESDYYVLIVGGRYGSVDENGVSFTEREYDYAKETGKVILPFLHANPDDLRSGDCDLDPKLRDSLGSFIKKVKDHNCSFWKTAEELKSKIMFSITEARDTHPATGWIPGKYEISHEVFKELEELRQLAQKASQEIGAKEGGLAQGDDYIDLVYGIYENKGKGNQQWIKSHDAAATWDQIFVSVGKLMYSSRGATGAGLHHIEDAVFDALGIDRRGRVNVSGSLSPPEYYLEPGTTEKIAIQLQALELIEMKAERDGYHNANRSWILTQRGMKRFITENAIKRVDN